MIYFKTIRAKKAAKKAAWIAALQTKRRASLAELAKKPGKKGGRARRMAAAEARLRAKNRANKPGTALMHPALASMSTTTAAVRATSAISV